MEQMEGIISALFYNVYSTPSAISHNHNNTNCYHSVYENNTKYLIDIKINKILLPLWNMLVDQVNIIEQGETAQSLLS